MNTFRLMTTLRRLKKIKEMLNKVEHSQLSTEEKQKVLQAYQNVIHFAWIYGSFMVISSVIFAIVVGLNFPEDDPEKMMMIMLVAIPVVAVVEIAILVIVPLMMLRGTGPIIYKVEMGFDGKSEEELKRFALSKKEKKSVTKYNVGQVFWSVALIIAIGITYMLFKSSDRNIILVIAGVIVSIFCFVMEDSCRVEQHRIKSGYYKKEYGFYCGNCRNKVTVPFERLHEYENLKRNEAGIRILYCAKCGNAVPFIGFDQALKDYKKYLKNR